MVVIIETDSCNRSLKEGCTSFIHIGGSIPVPGRPNMTYVKLSDDKGHFLLGNHTCMKETVDGKNQKSRLHNIRRKKCGKARPLHKL